MRVTINKIFCDRRAFQKPTWLCVIAGGPGPNNLTVEGKGVGCNRPIAYARALRAWRKAAKRA